MSEIIYGYARVSTVKQDVNRQIENIKSVYPDAIIVSEKYTGTRIDRPSWSKLYDTVLKKAAKGEKITIVFDEVSRMSRNAEEGFKAYKALYEAGVRLVFLKESALNTDTFRKAEQIAKTGNRIADIYIDATNEVLMILAEQQIINAFASAEWEVVTKRKNIKDGVRRAQAEGKQVGRAEGTKVETKKAKEMKQRIRKMSKDFEGNQSDKEIMEILKIARNSYYKYKAELKEEM